MFHGAQRDPWYSLAAVPSAHPAAFWRRIWSDKGQGIKKKVNGSHVLRAHIHCIAELSY